RRPSRMPYGARMPIRTPCRFRMTTTIAQPAPLPMHTLYGQTMGTRWRVDLQAPQGAPLEPLHAAVQAPLDAIDAQMSTWRGDSDLMRYNRADAGSWQALPCDFFAVTECALEVAEASEGAFDPTVGALVGAWGFGAHAVATAAPDTRTLAQLRAGAG